MVISQAKSWHIVHHIPVFLINNTYFSCDSFDVSMNFSDMPFGQVPVLMVDDKRLPQSGAIVRYLAKEFKLVGDNPLHAAFADMLFETLNEKLYKFPFVEKDEEKRVSSFLSFFTQHF